MTGLANTETAKTLFFLKTSLAFAIAFGFFAVFFPLLGNSLFQRLEGGLSQLARRRTLAISVTFICVIGLRLLLLPLLPAGIPGIHDEYSYLLMADTFAHGRLANPTHPMWISFETFHVNWFPTYSSMYPPAQGFVLAVGQLLGHPWIGVLLSNAAMCAAILWMLQAWMPPRWAFLGAGLAALKLGLASYWMNSYWGGAVASVGGALVLGALPRIARRANVRDALLLGFGMAILANSRPYEGLLFCSPAIAWFLWWLIGKTNPAQKWRVRVRRGLLPLLAVLVAAAAFMAYYNWRVTGSALLMPHVLNTRTYHTAPLFLWQRAAVPLQYRNQQFEDFYNGWERDNYEPQLVDALRVSVEKVIRGGITYLWVGALFAFPFLISALRSPRLRSLLVSLAVTSAGIFAVVWSNPHYAAPLTAVIFAFTVQAIRHLRTLRMFGRPVGIALSRAVLLLLVLDTATLVSRHTCDPLVWPCEGDPSRVAITEKLEHTPGKHLVIVRYDGAHNIHDEWVYNGADIDGSKVLWARELSPEQNAKLFAYFKDRRIWLVTPDIDNTYLEPYPPLPLNANRAQ
jgi:hypothetical protein